MFTPINPNTAKQDIRGYANASSVDSNVVLKKCFLYSVFVLNTINICLFRQSLETRCLARPGFVFAQ